MSEFDFNSLPIHTTYVCETERDGWKCDQWRVTIGAGKSQFVTDYFTGLGHRKIRKGAIPIDPKINKKSIAYAEWEKKNIVPVVPDNKGIMYSLLLDSEASEYSFNDWCDIFGYSNDSISAFNTYQKCCSISEKLRKVFSQTDIQQMRKALEDY